MPREAALPRSCVWMVWLPAAWRAPLLRLALVWLGLTALMWGDWA